MEPAQRFREFMTATGRRLTAQQAAIADMVFSFPATFDSEDIVTRLRNEASRATIFRTLQHLTQADLVHQVQLNGREVYVVTAELD